MVPLDGKPAEDGADPGGLSRAAVIRQDIPHLRKGDKGGVGFDLSAFACLEQALHAFKAGFPVGQRDECGSIEQE